MLNSQLNAFLWQDKTNAEREEDTSESSSEVLKSCSVSLVPLALSTLHAKLKKSRSSNL